MFSTKKCKRGIRHFCTYSLWSWGPLGCHSAAHIMSWHATRFMEAKQKNQVNIGPGNSFTAPQITFDTLLVVWSMNIHNIVHIGTHYYTLTTVWVIVGCTRCSTSRYIWTEKKPMQNKWAIIWTHPSLCKTFENQCTSPAMASEWGRAVGKSSK